MRLPVPLVAPMLRCALCVLLLAAGARPLAAEVRPIPSAPVQNADGTTVDLASLALNGTWVFVSVTAEAPVTVRLLRALESWHLALTPGQVVVLVDGTPAEVGRLEATWQTKVPMVRFVADDKGQARRALQVRALPTIVGGRSGMVEWQVAGVLNDPAMLRAVVEGWLASTTP
jgi:hypothetical protein